MVSFSRAGYGSSTRNPRRSVADVTPDVAAVLDEAGAHRFYTLGWSGGGPHALACAALLPERVIGAATVGSLAPYGAEGLDWMADMGEENVAAFSAAVAGEAELRTVAERVAPSFATVTAEEVAARLGKLVSEVDRAAISGEAAAWLAGVFRESVRNGMWGWFDDGSRLSGRGASTLMTSTYRWRSGRGAGSDDALCARRVAGVAHSRSSPLPSPRSRPSLTGRRLLGRILDDLLTIAPT